MINKNTGRALCVLATAAILALVIGLLTSQSPHWTPPPVNVAFLRFTNSAAATEALFALSNPPAAALTLHSVRAAAPVTGAGANVERGSFSWCRREQWGLLYAITVDSTNEPLRVVLEFHEVRGASAQRVIELARELFGLLTHNEHEFFTGPVSFVTNETRISPH